MDVAVTFDWCWLSPRCLAFPVAFGCSLVAIARRVQMLPSRPKNERGCFAILRQAFVGATITGIVSFGLTVGLGSLWKSNLDVVVMLVMLASVAVDWSTDASSQFMRDSARRMLEIYITSKGYHLEEKPRSPSPKLPDDKLDS